VSAVTRGCKVSRIRPLSWKYHISSKSIEGTCPGGEQPRTMDHWTRDYRSDSRICQERTKKCFAIITFGGFRRLRGRLYFPENEWDLLETHENLSCCMMERHHNHDHDGDAVQVDYSHNHVLLSVTSQRQLAHPIPPLLIGGIATGHSNASRVDVHWLLIAAVRNVISCSPNKFGGQPPSSSRRNLCGLRLRFSLCRTEP
jgi:hypothetical protein